MGIFSANFGDCMYYIFSLELFLAICPPYLHLNSSTKHSSNPRHRSFTLSSGHLVELRFHNMVLTCINSVVADTVDNKHNNDNNNIILSICRQHDHYWPHQRRGKPWRSWRSSLSIWGGQWPCSKHSQNNRACCGLLEEGQIETGQLLCSLNSHKSHAKRINNNKYVM